MRALSNDCGLSLTDLLVVDRVVGLPHAQSDLRTRHSAEARIVQLGFEIEVLKGLLHLFGLLEELVHMGAVLLPQQLVLRPLLLLGFQSVIALDLPSYVRRDAVLVRFLLPVSVVLGHALGQRPVVDAFAGVHAVALGQHVQRRHERF